MSATMNCIGIGATLCIALVGTGCGTSSADAERCDELINAAERCHPGLGASMECGPETLEPYEGMDLSTMSCSMLEDPGKADLWAIDDGSIDVEALAARGYWPPTSSDWQAIASIVSAYQAEAPGYVLDELDGLLALDRSATVSVTFEQIVDDGLGEGPRPMAVEISQGIIGLSLETFLERLPAEQWGTSLGHYLDGEVVAVEWDSQGRATGQVERMVLSNPPLDIDIPCLNADMTKLEYIVYGQDDVTVYWRVVYSDNGSTESDVGSVSFSRLGPDETLVTFHSAHRLRGAFGIPIPTLIAQLALGPFFEDHIDHYRDVVSGY